MTALRWTTTPPDRPGFYWCRNKGREEKMVRVDKDAQGCFFSCCLPDCFDVAPQREWSGPIPNPQEAAA
jgi:hypothetical protein